MNSIDFEFAAYNYQAFDIAMHFCDYAGIVNSRESLSLVLNETFCFDDSSIVNANLCDS